MQEVIILPIKFYQIIFSPLIGKSCRYQPTCSNYAMTAIRTNGVFYGLYQTGIRILKCNPWGGSGYDPVIIRPKKIRQIK